MELRDKVALVTGGGRRVGRAIALALGREGARVAVHYNSSSRGADEVVSSIVASGADAFAFQADMTAADSPARLAEAVQKRFDALDVLVNSAASMERTPLDGIDLQAWERIMTLNFRAPFFLALEVAKVMKAAATRGVIVNIGDLAASETWPEYIVHGLSKAGVDVMTRSLARVLAPEIRVNCVAPGAVMLPDKWPADEERKIVASTPLRRIGSPEDVAEAVVYLAKSEYVTGVTLVVDGGRSIRY